MSIITKTNDIGKYFLIIRSKKNTLFSSEYFFSFILLPLRYFSILIKRVHYIILKVNIIFLVFVSFSHFFSQLMQILLYVFTCLAFLSHLRRCKYHYYGMFILSVFVAKVLCLIKITFSVSHLTFHDCNSSIGMMPFPLCVTVE